MKQKFTETAHCKIQWQYASVGPDPTVLVQESGGNWEVRVNDAGGNCAVGTIPLLGCPNSGSYSLTGSDGDQFECLGESGTATVVET